MLLGFLCSASWSCVCRLCSFYHTSFPSFFLVRQPPVLLWICQKQNFIQIVWWIILWVNGIRIFLPFNFGHATVMHVTISSWSSVVFLVFPVDSCRVALDWQKLIAIFSMEVSNILILKRIYQFWVYEQSISNFEAFKSVQPFGYLIFQI